MYDVKSSSYQIWYENIKRKYESLTNFKEIIIEHFKKLRIPIIDELEFTEETNKDKIMKLLKVKDGSKIYRATLEKNKQEILDLLEEKNDSDFRNYMCILKRLLKEENIKLYGENGNKRKINYYTVKKMK